MNINIDTLISECQTRNPDIKGFNTSFFFYADFVVMKTTLQRYQNLREINKRIIESGIAGIIYPRIMAEKVIGSDVWFVENRIDGQPIHNWQYPNQNGETIRYSLNYVDEMKVIKELPQEFFDNFVNSLFHLEQLGIKVDSIGGANLVLTTDGFSHINLEVYNQNEPTLPLDLSKRIGEMLEKCVSAFIEPTQNNLTESDSNEVMKKLSIAISKSALLSQPEIKMAIKALGFMPKPDDDSSVFSLLKSLKY